ncbi:DUF5988 family protein [Micromonospora eburnea]|uniref:Uncharacterized protein n=1 Tax=Micromonospora eburnea TaxID=227316 RepID=A0A1C6V0E6_9ACTN|nr:DUF5988 family protein [Micromonospora eburnea]SCL59785.1 hypothetical protein GA0070604_4140 [Micromonospora eburnea]
MNVGEPSAVPVQPDEETVEIILEGGPADLTKVQRVVRADSLTQRIKIVRLGGYEHFERDPHTPTPPDDARVVFRWTARTRIAE